MSKKGMSPEFLVGLIATAAFLGIALFFLGPAILKLLFGSAEKGQCNVEFILSQLGEVEQVEGCKMHDLVVTPQVLAEEMTAGKVQYATLKKADALGSIGNLFDPSRPGAEEAWALNRIIANEMAGCYDKTLGGKALAEVSVFSTNFVCVVCSRITLTKETQQIFQSTFFGGRINTYLNTWMQTVPYKKGKMLYSDYITQRLIISDDLGPGKWSEVLRPILTTYPPYDTTMEKSMAVMLVRIPIGGADDLKWIQIYPYEKITALDFGYLMPSVTYFGADVKCKTIIQ